MPAHVVTLTLNPTVDLSTSVGRVEAFAKLRCGPVRRDPGGGGVNVARVLKRFGLDVTAIYPKGSFTGELLAYGIQAEGISSIAIPIGGETREDFTVLETQSGNQFRFVMPGPALSESEWRECLAAISPGADFVVASGSLPPGVPDNVYAQAARIAKKQNAKFVLDTSGAALREALKEGVWLVKPNLRELREYLDMKLDDEAARVAAARSLVAKGAAQIVALSLAEEGALLVSGEEAFRARAPSIKPLSTVGAGDSFVGAMVWRLALGHGLSDALRHGVAAGTAALLSPGTELCHAVATEELLPLITVEKI